MDKLVLSFNDVPLILVIFQCLLFSVLLLIINIGKRTANIFLAGFLLSLGFDALDTLLYWSPSIKQVYFPDSVNIFYYLKFGVYVSSPMLFLYVKAVIHKDVFLSRKDLLHFIPITLFIVFIAMFFTELEPEERKISLTQYGFLFNTAAFQFHLWVKNILYVGYGGLCFYILHQYTEELKQQFSNIDSIDMFWLRMLIGGFLLIWLWVFIPYLFTLFNASQWTSNIIGIIGNIFNFIFVNALVLYSVANSKFGRRALNKNPADEIKHIEKMDFLVIEKINEVMNGERLFLNPELTLDQLAERSNISSRKISSAINRSYNQNFFDYTNSFRVKMAAQLMCSDNANISTLDLLKHSGFNSKSTFYRAFRKSLNMTPSEYIKKSKS